jgi:two-component system chemotaxis sensor kinase CheA
MMIRAQPVKTLFRRMNRIVREASSDLGKNVRLETRGDNTEVDKTVIERLADPLTHMIRNAVDHGIEAPQKRAANGKPEQGVITLVAKHRSGRVILEIGDDGGGINRERVLQTAIDKGLVRADETPTGSGIDNFLFAPGFSTTDTVSNLSGRGVGMDVVKTAITSLGGRISIDTERGKGTSFTISLPLTLAVLDGMIVEVAGQILVIPLSTICETFLYSGLDIRALGPGKTLARLRDTFVPVVDLGVVFGYRQALDDYRDTVVLLINLENGTRAALIVDSIHDQRQVVIKGLQDVFGHPPGVAAATILGDGRIALILDPVDIIVAANGLSQPLERVG